MLFPHFRTSDRSFFLFLLIFSAVEITFMCATAPYKMPTYNLGLNFLFSMV